MRTPSQHDTKAALVVADEKITGSSCRLLLYWSPYGFPSFHWALEHDPCEHRLRLAVAYAAPPILPRIPVSKHIDIVLFYPIERIWYAVNRPENAKLRVDFLSVYCVAGCDNTDRLR